MVAGVRTPMKISEMEEKFPEAFEQFKNVCKTLETHYRDMQDMEFTVEHGKLYMLQTRNGKRTAKAALKIACDLVDEGMRTEEEAVAMIDPRNLDSLLHPQFDADALKKAVPIGRLWEHLRGLHADGSYLPRTMRKSGPREARKSFWYVWRLHRRYHRYEVRAGYPDRPRRHDFSCGGSCPRYGDMLCIRMRRHGDGRSEQEVHTWRKRVP